MAIKFKCPECDATLVGTPEMVGRKIKCAACGAIFPMPDASAAPSPPPPPKREPEPEPEDDDPYPLEGRGRSSRSSRSSDRDDDDDPGGAGARDVLPPVVVDQGEELPLGQNSRLALHPAIIAHTAL